MSREYKCEDCGVKNVKLWREYQSFNVHLRCYKCAAKYQDKEIPDITKEGKVKSEIGGLTDQIGWCIPAIPSPDGFWGYTSVPQEDVEWWKNLPNDNQIEEKLNRILKDE